MCECECVNKNHGNTLHLLKLDDFKLVGSSSDHDLNVFTETRFFVCDLNKMSKSIAMSLTHINKSILYIGVSMSLE